MQNDRIQKIAKDVIQFEINALKNLKNNINLSFSKVVKLILNFILILKKEHIHIKN